jgi:hypothetical protein
MPQWKDPGNVTPVDEYLRRQAMSAKDYVDFLERLKRGVVLRAARPAPFNRYILRAFRTLDVDVFSYCHWRTVGLCSPFISGYL